MRRTSARVLVVTLFAMGPLAPGSAQAQSCALPEGVAGSVTVSKNTLALRRKAISQEGQQALAMGKQAQAVADFLGRAAAYLPETVRVDRVPAQQVHAGIEIVANAFQAINASRTVDAYRADLQAGIREHGLEQGVVMPALTALGASLTRNEVDGVVPRLLNSGLAGLNPNLAQAICGGTQLRPMFPFARTDGLTMSELTPTIQRELERRGRSQPFVSPSSPATDTGYGQSLEGVYGWLFQSKGSSLSGIFTPEQRTGANAGFVAMGIAVNIGKKVVSQVINPSKAERIGDATPVRNKDGEIAAWNHSNGRLEITEAGQKMSPKEYSEMLSQQLKEGITPENIEDEKPRARKEDKASEEERNKQDKKTDEKGESGEKPIPLTSTKTDKSVVSLGGTVGPPRGTGVPTPTSCESGDPHPRCEDPKRHGFKDKRTIEKMIDRVCFVARCGPEGERVQRIDTPKGVKLDDRQEQVKRARARGAVVGLSDVVRDNRELLPGLSAGYQSKLGHMAEDPRVSEYLGPDVRELIRGFRAGASDVNLSPSPVCDPDNPRYNEELCRGQGGPKVPVGAGVEVVRRSLDSVCSVVTCTEPGAGRRPQTLRTDPKERMDDRERQLKRLESLGRDFSDVIRGHQDLLKHLPAQDRERMRSAIKDGGFSRFVSPDVQAVIKNLP